ncbi:hypothetical protein SAMN06269117_11628 [Balnearium lithotrophicum]|uniref:YbbR-like protein n=1 Tax=Balnearium lithotrophicum TaxID=223788 RepID=A0A521CZS8_9BACT|nr:hypothetical protein [Balnearium lithotrophicum]SMO64955.1 hypothetical protein SAMN06269117_11628 [Balnearium lithotrophicum]
MKRIYEIVFRNFHYKLLAFLFAVLLWFLATNKEIVETTIEVPFKPVSTGNYKIADYQPKSLKIKVEGYRKDIITLENIKEVKVLVPSKVEESGWITVKLDKNSISLPVESVKIKKVHPKKITVKIEKLYKKVVPIELNAVGIPRKAKINIVPNYAVLLLPEELKETVFNVKTERIDLTGVKLPAVLVLRIDTYYKAEPKRVRVTIEEGK